MIVKLNVNEISQILVDAVKYKVIEETAGPCKFRVQYNIVNMNLESVEISLEKNDEGP